MSEEEQREDECVERVKFSEDGSLLEVRRSKTLEVWKTSTWECLSSVPCMEDDISHGGVQVTMDVEGLLRVQLGNASDETDTVPGSTHDHVHWIREEIQGNWVCSGCKNSRLNNSEYFSQVVIAGYGKWRKIR